MPPCTFIFLIFYHLHSKQQYCCQHGSSNNIMRIGHPFGASFGSSHHLVQAQNTLFVLHYTSSIGLTSSGRHMRSIKIIIVHYDPSLCLTCSVLRFGFGWVSAWNSGLHFCHVRSKIGVVATHIPLQPIPHTFCTSNPKELWQIFLSKWTKNFSVGRVDMVPEVGLAIISCCSYPYMLLIIWSFVRTKLIWTTNHCQFRLSYQKGHVELIMILVISHCTPPRKYWLILLSY